MLCVALRYYASMKKITLCLSLLSLNIFANEGQLTLGHTYSNDLILRSQNCEELIEEHKNICAWKKSLDPSFTIPNINKTQCKLNKNIYAMTVSTCLPDFVKQNQNKALHQSGANCWGTAMSFRGISKKPRFIWQDEMIYWMNSPLCRKLAPGEERKAGDILNVYGPEYVFKDRDETQEKGYQFFKALDPSYLLEAPVTVGYSGYHNFLHSEVFISDKLVFGKESPSYQDSFKFSNIQSVYGRSRDEDCQENQSLELNLREYQNSPRNIRDSRCGYFTNVYRCENANEYFEASKLTDSEKLILEEINKLQDMQNRLFEIQYEKKVSMQKAEQNQLLNYADASAASALEKLATRSFTKNTEMLLALQYFSAQGIRKSMELARLIPATETL